MEDTPTVDYVGQQKEISIRVLGTVPFYCPTVPARHKKGACVFITYSYAECPKCGAIVITETHDKIGNKGDSPRIGDSLICQNSDCREKFEIKELKLGSGPLKGNEATTAKMPETRIRFTCQSCKQAWSLPPQILAKVMPNRSVSPSAVLTASFLCSLCGALSRRTPEQLPEQISRNPAPSLPSDATVLLCITFPCGYSDCGLPITIHIVADAQKGTDERKRLTDIALLRKPAKSCALCHPATSLSQQLGLISVFDELVWEASAY